MAKSIVPNKCIIFIDNSGNISDAILQYQIMTDGVTPPGFKTVSVLSALDPTALGAMATAALGSAATSEGI